MGVSMEWVLRVFEKVQRVFDGSFKGVSRKFQECFKGIQRLKDVSRYHYGIPSRVSKRTSRAVSSEFQKCF